MIEETAIPLPPFSWRPVYRVATDIRIALTDGRIHQPRRKFLGREERDRRARAAKRQRLDPARPFQQDRAGIDREEEFHAIDRHHQYRKRAAAMTLAACRLWLLDRGLPAAREREFLLK